MLVLLSLLLRNNNQTQMMMMMTPVNYQVASTNSVTGSRNKSCISTNFSIQKLIHTSMQILNRQQKDQRDRHTSNLLNFSLKIYKSIKKNFFNQDPGEVDQMLIRKFKLSI